VAYEVAVERGSCNFLASSAEFVGKGIEHGGLRKFSRFSPAAADWSGGTQIGRRSARVLSLFFVFNEHSSRKPA